MGTGRSGAYSGTRGGSQPYAESYHVVDEMLRQDKKDPDIYDPETGYFKNPSAISLREAIRNNRFYQRNGKKTERDFMYVMDKNGNIIFGKRENPNDGRKRSPHPTLIGGKDPQVQCAGIITFRDGKILSVNNQSGHYRPNIKSMAKVEAFLEKLYKENSLLFNKESKWRQRKNG